MGATLPAWSASDERRSSARIDVDCPARLLMTSGTRVGRILNISRQGVRIACATPPMRGATVLLQWLELEAFCRVAWAQADACGLVFERMISEEAVIAVAGTAEPKAAASETIANHCNIPLGQKRGGRLRIVTE